MVRAKQSDSKATAVREWLKSNPRKTTKQIADAIGWTSGRVSAVVWADMRSSSPALIREERQDPGRTTSTYVYSHRDTYSKQIIAPSTEIVQLPPKDEQPKVQPPVRVTYGDLQDIDKPGPVHLVPTTPLAEQGLDSVVEELARAIAKQVLSRVEAQLAVQLKHILPATTQPLKPISIEALTRQVMPVEHQGSHRPTVLIAGLLPNQAGIIQQEFGEVFDLRFYMVEENLSRLRAMLPGADHVFTFTSKISHKVEEVMNSRGKTINRCSGGMTMLKEQLLNLYVTTEGKPA